MCLTSNIRKAESREVGAEARHFSVGGCRFAVAHLAVVAICKRDEVRTTLPLLLGAEARWALQRTECLATARRNVRGDRPAAGAGNGSLNLTGDDGGRHIGVRGTLVITKVAGFTEADGLWLSLLCSVVLLRCSDICEFACFDLCDKFATRVWHGVARRQSSYLPRRWHIDSL